MTAIVEAQGVAHRFDRPALDNVSLSVAGGEIHALLGPNGAGKTTLLRVLCGLLSPQRGVVRVNGEDGVRDPHAIRKHIGLVPSGDGTLYPRLSALENLVFFGRLYGLRRRDAVARAEEVLAEVGLIEVAQKRVHAYSHGMQKRLAFARALLTEPRVLLIDEATHDLDPRAAHLVRSLTTRAAERGAAIVWTTQRLDEIRGFARTATMLDRGTVCFYGSVVSLLGRVPPRRYVLKLSNGGATAAELRGSLQAALTDIGTIAAAHTATDDDYELVLHDGHVIGDAMQTLDGIGVRVMACREEKSGLEEAFLSLTKATT